MTPDLLALGRRAVACKSWLWLPGCRVLTSSGVAGTVTAYSPRITGRLDVSWDGGVVDRCTDPTTIVPDLDAPSSLGCLLGLVREAWGDEAFVRRLIGGTVRDPCWVCQTHGRDWYLYEGATEAEALVAALESAPEAAP